MFAKLLLGISLFLSAGQAIAETKVPAGTVRFKHQASPTGSTPAGHVDVYCKSDNNCYKRQPGGTEASLGGGASTSLNNIGSTALSADLLCASSGSCALGSAATPFGASYLGLLKDASGVNSIGTVGRFLYNTSGTSILNFNGTYPSMPGITIAGATSGSLTILVPAALVTNRTITLPATPCALGEAWVDDGFGVMSCGSGGGGGSGSTFKGRFICGPGSADANTTLLMNFDQAPPLDFSTAGGAITSPNGSPSICGTQAKFGSTSFCLNGATANYAVTGPGALGTGDFTIEWFIWGASFAANAGAIVHSQDGGGNWWNVRSTGTQIEFGNYNGITCNTGGFLPSNSAQHHIVIQRNTTTNTLLVDGVPKGTCSDSGNYTQSQVRVGYSVAQGTAFNGYIDELRISNTARYNPAGFTPPASAFTITNLEYNPSSWITSVSGSATGTCTMAIASPISGEAVCTCTPVSSSAGRTCQATTSGSGSSVSFKTYVGTTLTTSGVAVICQ